MRSIRCGRGLGDSIYLQSVVRHMLLKGGLSMQVASDYPAVFWPLGRRVHVVPFTRRVDIVAHYVMRKQITTTTQFQDCCIRAGIEDAAELRLDWTVTNPDLHARIRETGRPVLVVQMPRSPMGRTDGFGKTLLPDCRAIQRLIDERRDTHHVVQIGAGRPLFNFRGLHVDMANRTTVAELIDIVHAADECLGYPSFLVPLAESLDKPALFVWSARGLRDGQPFIRAITPQKLLHKPATSRFVIDEEALAAMREPA
jgi:hypothetical protein